MPVLFEQPKASPVARVAADRSRGQAGAKSGLGSRETVTVKGARASATQRAAINSVLQEANSLGASSRVMIAVIMCITQEADCIPSTIGHSQYGDQVGLFQQSSGWGTQSQCLDPATAVKFFLEGGTSAGTFGWTHYNGSVKNAPGDLATAIEQVQHSGLPSLYAQWQTEATATVTAFLGGDLASAGTTGSDTTTKVEPYEFTRGQSGQPETSWACSGRLATDVAWSRWAQINTLFFVSDNELRAAAPAITIHGDEYWLRNPIAYEWSPKRAANKLTLDVWAAHWGIQIGAAVEIAMGRAIDGIYLVTETHGTWVSPELQVVLERPAPKRLEPAPTTTSSSSSSSGTGSFDPGDGSKFSKLVAACKYITQQHRAYLYGGGHGPSLASLVKTASSLDCSSSTSLALFMAGMFPGSTAIVSGDFATSWGVPGKGSNFTVWATDGHVYIEFYGVPGIVQFNTVPSGGPQIRSYAASSDDGRTPRHWPGN